MKCSLLICMLCIAALGSTQKQEQSHAGSLGEFTQAPIETVIVQIDQPFVVRSVTGIIRRDTGDEAPLAQALFEVRGPDDQKMIYRSITDDEGRFRIRHLRSGRYAFKATFAGFQSVVGTIIVSSKADKAKSIAIKMPLGV